MNGESNHGAKPLGPRWAEVLDRAMWEAQLDAIERHRRANVPLVMADRRGRLEDVAPDEALRRLGFDPVRWRRELPEDRDRSALARMNGDVWRYIPPPSVSIQ